MDGPAGRTYVEAMTPDPLNDPANAGSADAQTVADRPGWLRAVKKLGLRWPTAVALAFAAYSLWEIDDGVEYVIIFVLPATGYLFMSIVGRRRITWIVVVAATLTVVMLRALDVDPWPVLATVVLALVAVGLLNGQLRRPGFYVAQAPGAIAFMAAGLVVLALPTTAAGFLVAAGLIGHATWDFIHLRADKIVARSFAEWCGVLDLTLGLGVLTFLTINIAG